MKIDNTNINNASKAFQEAYNNVSNKKTKNLILKEIKHFDRIMRKCKKAFDDLK